MTVFISTLFYLNYLPTTMIIYILHSHSMKNPLTKYISMNSLFLILVQFNCECYHYDHGQGRRAC